MPSPSLPLIIAFLSISLLIILAFTITWGLLFLIYYKFLTPIAQRAYKEYFKTVAPGYYSHYEINESMDFISNATLLFLISRANWLVNLTKKLPREPQNKWMLFRSVTAILYG